MAKEAMPARTQGSYLARRDIERLKRFIVNLINPQAAEEPKPSDASPAGENT
jgi:hypothetical protein